MNILAFFILIVSVVWVIIDVWRKNNTMSVTKKIIWTICALLFNVLTALVYLFSKSKFFRYIAVLLLIILISSFIYWKYAFTYSKGYRAGLLQKFSEKGMVFKTYEGEMVLSSVQSNANVAIASEKFIFSVEDEPIAKQMEQIQGKHVIVHYREKNGALPWRGESQYIVDSVRVADVAGGTHTPN